MSDNRGENLKIRRYLLGTSQDIEEIDNKILLDDEFYQRFLAEEDELIQDYADGDLSAAERESFEKHFLISDDRKQKLKFARALRKYVDENRSVVEKQISKPAAHGFKSFFGGLFSPVPAFAFVLALVCLGLGGWYFFSKPNEIAQAQTLLDNAYRAARPFEPRVSAFSYAPFSNTRGGAAADGKINLNERNQAELLLLNRANAKPDAENLHALGRLYLVKKEFDQAIAQLEKALKSNARDAPALSDLGAARLEKAKTLPNEDDKKMLTAQAIEDFSKALEIEPALPEALFNKAVALEEMNLSEEARRAWEDYLKLDDKSPWADEARKNLESLGAAQSPSKTGAEILREFMANYRIRDDDAAYRTISRNREMITNKLVAQQLVFSFLEAPSEAEKAEYLEALKYAGRLELKISGDPYVSDIADFYAKVSAAKLEDLRNASALVKSGYELSGASKEPLALEQFRLARKIYGETGSEAEARLCDYWIGYALARTGGIEDSTKLLEQLDEFSRKKNYKWLGSQAANWLAYNALNTKDVSKAIEYNERALLLSEQTFDLYNTQKSLSQRADIYREASDYAKAVNFINKALTLARSPEVAARQKWRDYRTAAGVFFSLKFYNVSAAYAREGLYLGLSTENSSFAANSYRDLGLIVGKQGKLEDALLFFGKSREIIEKFDNEKLKMLGVASNDKQTADVFRQEENCGDALEFYDRAVSFYADSESKALLYESRKGRLLCYLTTGDDAAFEKELAEVLNLFRDYRTKILEEQSRNAFFDGEQDVYDVAVEFAVKKGDDGRAFGYSEESRARSLLDLKNSLGKVAEQAAPEVKFLPVTAEPFDLAKIQAEMPENVQILQYSVLADKTLIWLITREKVLLGETLVASADLQAKTADYQRIISANLRAEDETASALAAELYDALIAPVKERLDPNKKICLIPDKFLFPLPFAALRAQSGTYFLAEREFFLAPSASVFLLNTKKAREQNDGETESLLSIGNPAFDKRNFPELSELPEAVREAREIERFYDRPKIVLTDRQAFKQAVKTGIEKANVIHFAGHYAVNEFSPLLSGLVVAGEKADERQSSILANYEILGGKMPAAKLIVLSACETGGERVYRGEGMLGAARAFLAAGVPLVVASQWKVDSQATAELMINFHRYRRLNKMPVSAALRRAQLDMLESGNQSFRNPYYWAAFTAFGGYTEF